VDASGRTSKFPAWLTAMGATIRIEDDDAEIVYYTRHYKLNPAELEPSRHGKERSAGDLGYIKYGVFPGDNGNFAIIVCLPNHETELREAVKSGDTFDAICQAIPGLAPWIAQGKSTPTTASFGFGDIHAVWKHYVHDGIPVALNYFVVGDSAVRTNPLYGRGCSTGIIHGHLLSDTLEELSDPLARAIRFDQRTEEALRPIFDTSLAEDKRSIERALAISENRSLDDAGSLKKWFRAAIGDAISAAVRDEIHVLRGAMRTFNLMEKPGDFLKDNHIRWTIFRYLFRGRKRNSQARLQNGPNRQEMLAILQAMLKKEVA
jgi:2-polyprenyl-6-methoxyphenol hydroxylase-like FAD-dependent oxidoreductase